MQDGEKRGKKSTEEMVEAISYYTGMEKETILSLAVEILFTESSLASLRKTLKSLGYCKQGMTIKGMDVCCNGYAQFKYVCSECPMKC